MSTEEHPTLVREVALEVAEGDGRTIEARIVPYNERATVCDPPDYVIEEEEFAPGSVDHQIKAAHRVKVWLTTLHEEGLRGIIGHGETLEDRDDGLYASFRVHDNADGNKALHLVREGLLPAMSVEFKALKSDRSIPGLVRRLKVHLDKVSLVPVGAYKGAEVLAVRQPPPEPEPVVELPRLSPLPSDLAVSLLEQGFRIEPDPSDAA